jgi:hypothetical protein
MNTTVNKYKLKYRLTELLQSGREITLDFNCGNDEAHIVPFIDGQAVEYGDLYFNLEELIYVDLELPSNGEFMVTGKGHLTLEENDVFLFYDLEGFTYDYSDADELSGQPDYEPKRNVTERPKGKIILLSEEYDDPVKLEESLSVETQKATIKTEEVRPKPWWQFW